MAQGGVYLQHRVVQFGTDHPNRLYRHVYRWRLLDGGAIVSFGVILAMGQYVSRFWQPITNLANIYNMFVNNIAYLERIFETMDEPVVVDDVPGAAELPPIRGDVEFRNVTFAYEEGVNILENLNFTVKAGQSVALVGPTRCPARPLWSISSAGSIISTAGNCWWTDSMILPR